MQEENSDTESVENATQTEEGLPDSENGGQAATEEVGDTFPRAYVEQLRKESADYRGRAKAAEQRADQLSHRLHAELVRATGKLADVSDLAYDATHVDDADALNAAIDELIERKPHLKARKLAGNIGQGIKGDTNEPFNLLTALKGLI